MKIVRTVAFALLVCSYASRFEDAVEISNERHKEALVDTGNIGVIDQLLSKLVNIVLGFVDVSKLGISLQQFACIKNEQVVSGIYGGRVLELKSNIVDVECSTHHIHVANPPHFWEDEDFKSDTLFEVDNLALHLQCDLDVFSEYAKFMAGSKIGSMFGKKREEEEVWIGRAICDIKEVNIDNPKIYVETLNRDTLFEGSLLRRQSNVDRFLRKVKDTFGGQEAPEEIPEEVAPTAGQEASALITWTSMQNPVTKTASSCLQNPYKTMGQFVEHEGLCGFVLSRMELYIDGVTMVWREAYTKAVAQLMALSHKFTLTKILGYIVKYAGILAGPARGLISAVVSGISTVTHKFHQLKPFSKKES